MLFTKANLVIHKIASIDPEYMQLASLHIDEDGSTVACNPFVALTCSPAPDTTHLPETQLPDVAPGASGVNAKLDIVEKTCRNLPKGLKSVPVQVARLTSCDKGRVGFTTLDQGHEQTVSGPPNREQYPDWREIFRHEWKRIKALGANRSVIVNRKRLIQLLQVMDEASQDRTDETLVEIHFGSADGSVMLQSKNYETGQDLVAIANAVTIQGGWRPNVWVRKLLGNIIRKRRKR